MPDQQDAEVSTEPVNDLSAQIGTSLASVWARYVGARPDKAETELDGTVVRWKVTDGVEEFDKGMSAEADDDGKPIAPRTMPGFKRDTSAAVAKTTKRKVMAMISKHDGKTGLATETFILEQAPKRY